MKYNIYNFNYQVEISDSRFYSGAFKSFAIRPMNKSAIIYCTKKTINDYEFHL